MKKSMFLICGIFCMFLVSSNIDTYAQQDEEVFAIVEVHPQYPGGDEARIKFIQENLKYPVSAKEAGIQGNVYVTFIVEKDGSLSNVKILRGIGSGCDEEVIRVVKLMPAWLPGTQSGKPVRVQFNLPIKFKLAPKETK